MKANGKVVNCSKYCGLKQYDNSNQVHVSLRKAFDDSITDRFGPEISPGDLPDVNLDDTPLYDMYEENNRDVERGFAGENENNETPIMATVFDHEVPTPELNDININTSVILQRGNTYARDKIFVQIRYSDENAILRRNYKPIFETRKATAGEWNPPAP